MASQDFQASKLDVMRHHQTIMVDVSNDSLLRSSDVSCDSFDDLAMTTMTPSGNDTYIDLVKQPVYMIIVLSFAYGLVFIVALAGNLCVVAVVYKDRRFHTPTYVFIVNLALADLSVAIVCLPITLLTNLYNGKICFFTCN